MFVLCYMSCATLFNQTKYIYGHLSCTQHTRSVPEGRAGRPKNFDPEATYSTPKFCEYVYDAPNYHPRDLQVKRRCGFNLDDDSYFTRLHAKPRDN